MSIHIGSPVSKCVSETLKEFKIKKLITNLINTEITYLGILKYRRYVTNTFFFLAGIFSCSINGVKNDGTLDKYDNAHVFTVTFASQ